MMITKNQKTRLTFVLLVSFLMALIGCSSGSSSSSPSVTPTAVINVLPSQYSFGIVTDGNVATPRQIEIQNNGNANLSVTSIALSGVDAANFTLNLNGGADPCGSSNPTVLPGDSCTVLVGFVQSPVGDYAATLVIQSNDPNKKTVSVDLDGTYELIETITVKISQVEACPRNFVAKVYVSVVDQGGFSVIGLKATDFSLVEKIVDSSLGVPVDLTDFDFVNDKSSLSVALVMDYSRSIVSIAGALSNMENAAKIFVQQMNVDDEAEIIKYSGSVETIQGFTPDLDLLTAAIEYDPQFPGGTALYDAVEYAADRLKDRNKDRKAIIVLTDGQENSSIASLEEIISQAQTNGIPVFTVGFGEADPLVLQKLADETGGTYSESEASDNLIGIYIQIADLLFKNQYILSYNSGIDFNRSGELEVTVDYNGIEGKDTRTIPVCD